MADIKFAWLDENFAQPHVAAFSLDQASFYSDRWDRLEITDDHSDLIMTSVSEVSLPGRIFEVCGLHICCALRLCLTHFLDLPRKDCLFDPFLCEVPLFSPSSTAYPQSCLRISCLP